MFHSHGPSTGSSHLAITGWEPRHPLSAVHHCPGTVGPPSPSRGSGAHGGEWEWRPWLTSVPRSCGWSAKGSLCPALNRTGGVLQAPPLANSSPHWSAASLPTAPQRSRRRLRVYCSAHEILMQERLAGGGAAPGLGRGGGVGRTDKHPSCGPRHGVRISPPTILLPPLPRLTKGLLRASASASRPAALP